MQIAALCIALLLVHTNASAYIGPGLGAGVVSVILGLLASILLAIFAIFWYPIKRLIKKLRGAGKKPETAARQPETVSETAEPRE